MFEVKNLSVRYGKTEILSDVSFCLHDGSMVGLLGANGCGKTTLLKALCCILPHKGDCLLDSVRLEDLSSKEKAKRVSYIPQRSGISIDLTAEEAVLMGYNPYLRLLQQPTKEMKEAARRMLAKVGIEAGRNYPELSEGQKQLCILARTMVADGKLLLLDEPESALDLSNRYEIFELLRKWMGNRIVLSALHDPQLALQVCDTLLLLKDKAVFAVLHPQKDTIEQMEQALCGIYGTVKLRKVEESLVMIKGG